MPIDNYVTANQGLIVLGELDPDIFQIMGAMNPTTIAAGPQRSVPASEPRRHA